MKRLFRLIPLGFYVSLLVYAGCSGDDDPKPFDCATSDLALTVESVNPESCSVLNGSITATPAGGKPPYTYALNAGAFTSEPVFTNLSAGDYILRIKDKNGCIVQSNQIQLRIPGNDLSLAAITVADTECINDNGSITVEATGGTAPYEYKLNSGAFGTQTTFSSVATGNYTVTVKDAEGCVFPKAVVVPRGDTGTSLSGEIMPIIESKCAISNCHNGSQSPNLTSLAAVISNAAKIKSVTQSGEMPKNGSLSSSQKARIACWVDDGAKNN